ncbi:Rrf2 family transcriptional regulator [Lujinxingia vulgaris]|uniref:Rrf2 family transcriptional regulator n=1 Tax=Lujinxingia vulgaris TaxID=2600176 RepID=A0A5C6WWZ5_9DELT|nr:Rrf2 family transcriptional regulator [Lujinxingia vulgaris]TXD32423.1 Rrf2 family transcriptional regulator [Lujinxingia vulgaris]
MRLSNRAIYGLRAIFDLAYHSGGEPTQVREIAERAQVPVRFLEQIFLDLKRAGFVESKRGPRGGYRLVAEPAALTLAEVFGALEDLPELPDVLVEEVEESAARVPDVVCQEIFAKMIDLLSDVTVADLIERGEELGFSRQCYEGFTYVI